MSSGSEISWYDEKKKKKCLDCCSYLSDTAGTRGCCKKPTECIIIPATIYPSVPFCDSYICVSTILVENFSSDGCKYTSKELDFCQCSNITSELLPIYPSCYSFTAAAQ